MGDLDSNVCLVCDKVFTLRKNLNKHIRRVHKLEPDKDSKTVHCPKDDCSFSCNFLCQLRLHAQEEHMVEIVKENIVFKSRDDFLQWKVKEEKATCSSFVKKSGSWPAQNGSGKIIFRCHRSGNFRSESEGKRLLKSQGSNKLGGHCTATIELNLEGETCTVLYFKTHFGHEPHIGFLRISRCDREALADKLAEGVTMQRILDDTRDSINPQIERLHLLTRLDLHNIKRDFGINDTQQHISDDVSVNMWLAKMQDCVLINKKSGEKMDNVNINYRVIVLMSNLQCDLLKKFGPHIVCVDSTYSTNIYKLLITTLLVVDEFGSGVPVAFCIATRENTAVMTHFFAAVREKAGVIKTKVFMSDDTNVFRSAWATVMGLAENNLLCAWHVKRSWKNNLKKISGENKQKAVYEDLCMLLKEMDINKFSVKLESFEKDLREDMDTNVFGEYFTDNYAYRPHHWAYCYRKKLGINTNMYLEAMHRVLKYCYLDGKSNNRLDRLLVVLWKFVRDKMFERLIKLFKGGNSHRIQLINDRHVESKTVEKSHITVNDDGTVFTVRSTKNIGTVYTVVLNNLTCEVNCRMCCPVCNICVHTFSCTCPDCLLKLNICKHMHGVARNFLAHGRTKIETKVKEETSEILSHLKTEDEQGPTAQQKEISAMLHALASRVMSSKLSAETMGRLGKDVEHWISTTNSEFYSDVRHCARNEKFNVQQGSQKKNSVSVAKTSDGAVTSTPDSDVLHIDHTYSKS